jgi:thiamine pyrophosphate-dependent acetolactate synthase large subunit-like protein
VMTDLKNGSVFPTDHPAHVTEPFNQFAKPQYDLLAEADLILSFEWVDLGGSVCPPAGGSHVTAKIVNVTMDHHLHNGAHTVYQQMSPADVLVSASPEAVVADLNAALGGGKKDPWRAAIRRTYGPNESGKIRMADVAMELRKNFASPDDVTLAAVSRGWPCDLWPFRNSGAYMGKDGGGGIGSGPSLAIGVALANSDRGKETVAVLGDGDFLMGGHAIFTAVKHEIPILIIINNNQSYFNDELHQETVAKRRNRPVSNRWIGQSITPGVDIAKFVESQGAVGIGPVTSLADLPAAMKKGVEAMRAGKVALIDVHIPPADRGASSTGMRNT